MLNVHFSRKFNLDCALRIANVFVMAWALQCLLAFIKASFSLVTQHATLAVRDCNFRRMKITQQISICKHGWLGVSSWCSRIGQDAVCRELAPPALSLTTPIRGRHYLFHIVKYDQHVNVADRNSNYTIWRANGRGI